MTCESSHDGGRPGTHPGGRRPGGWRGYDGVFSATTDQWADAGRGVRLNRHRLHHGVWDHRHDQLRPRRGVYGLRLPVRHRPGAALFLRDPLLSAADFRHPGVHHRGHRRIRLGDRAHRLPAAAQLDAAGAADLGYRDVADPAELCPAEPGAEPAGDPDAA